MFLSGGCISAVVEPDLSARNSIRTGSVNVVFKRQKGINGKMLFLADRCGATTVETWSPFKNMFLGLSQWSLGIYAQRPYSCFRPAVLFGIYKESKVEKSAVPKHPYELPINNIYFQWVVIMMVSLQCFLLHLW